MPFQRAREHGAVRRLRLVDALEESGAEHATINDGAGKTQTLQRGAIQDATPFAVPAAVELVGMLESKQRFRLAVTRLLSEVRPRRLPPVMPDERPGSKRDPKPRLLQSPANVHVIAGLAILEVK